MSVSQVKKRFGEMESFLRGDKEALRRLKLLKDDVNVLRTSLAAAIEAKELAETIKDAARERADKAETEAERLRAENERLCMQLKAVEAQSRLSESREQKLNQCEPEPSADRPEDHDHVECKKMLKSLRRALPQCPRLTSKESVRHSPSFIRQEFADGWSHHSIWTLGASVAIIAAHEGSVTIIDPIGVIFKREGDSALNGMAMNFIRWFGKNFKENLTPKRVNFGNSGPAELIDP